MPRRRTQPLPRGITERKRPNGRTSYRVSFVDQAGTLRQETVPRFDDAKRLLAQRRAEVSAGTYRAPGEDERASMTLAAFADLWLGEQRARGARSFVDMELIVRLHIKPGLGSTRLDELAPPAVAAWVRGMDCAAKTVRNRHGVLHSIMELARFRGLVLSNAAALPRGMLPPLAKKREPRFTRDELWTLVSAPAIDAHRRIFYALQALGGLRCGEASGRRWRDLDVDTPELACLTVATQYDDKPLKTAKGERIAERTVPVHPALQTMLDDWRRSGFAATYGRPPRPDDWIVPDPRTGKPRTREQAGNALLRDLEAVGVAHRIGASDRGRRTHAFRRAFISLARSDGARADVLERITHNAAGSVLDGYTTLEWTATCEAVRCLRFELRRAEVVELRQAAGAEQASAGAAEPTCPAVCHAPPRLENTNDIKGEKWRCRESKPTSTRKTPANAGAPRSEPSRGRRENPAERGPFLTGKHGANDALVRAERILRDGGHVEEADAVAAVLAGGAERDA